MFYANFFSARIHTSPERPLSLTEWCHTWNLSVNEEKCCVLHFTTGHSPVMCNYSMNSKEISNKSTAKDLGSANLRCTAKIFNIFTSNHFSVFHVICGLPTSTSHIHLIDWSIRQSVLRRRLFFSHPMIVVNACVSRVTGSLPFSVDAYSGTTVRMKRTKVQTLGELRMLISCLSKVCSLVVVLDTLMRFVAWSDKLYSAFLLLWKTC